jgi:hypothetical protein
MIKKRRTYQPRIVGDKVMMPADLKRLPEYMLEVEHIDHISDEMRAVVESEWPELAYKLPPKTLQGADIRYADSSRLSRYRSLRRAASSMRISGKARIA